MQSNASSVNEYLIEVPAEQMASMKRLRTLFQQELKGYVEQMSYGVPCYAKDGIILAGFKSQKEFIGVYILVKRAFDKHNNNLRNATHGTGVIRFANPNLIDFKVIQQMLKATYESEEEV